MVGLRKIARFTTTEGNPIRIGDVTVTPRSTALVIRLPFGGIVWNRPVGVTVQRGDVIQDLPIRDLTRIAQIALVSAAAFLLIASRLIRSNRKETR